MNDFATNDEIKWAHGILLPGKPFFEKDKLDVIMSNESVDIKACPGSGKTTVLLAKLLILSRRMPFMDGKGICVLTHTNVAINEIKSRFGKTATLLFSYPNFCGTIQSFVDQFLTIPWFNSFNEKSLVTVDDDRANAIIRKEFENKCWQRRMNWNLLFYGNEEYQKAYEMKNWNKVKAMRLNAILKLYYDPASQKFYSTFDDKRAKATSQSNSYSFLDEIRLSAIREGILKYQDAYAFARHYCVSMPSIIESFAERFKYLFIDEVQDSSKMQLNVLDTIFDKKKVIVQRFGDPYQALYDSEGSSAWVPIKPLLLNSSKRFGARIANILKTVCIEDNSSLVGNNNVESSKPIMIVFSDAENVLHAFVNILNNKEINGESIAMIAAKERNEDRLHRINIKAIGFAGNKEDEVSNFTTIKQYFNKYEINTASKHPFGYKMTLNNYLQKDLVEETPVYNRDCILDAIVAALERVCVIADNGRKFSRSTLLDYLSKEKNDKYEELRKNLSKWSIDMAKSSLQVNPTVFDEVKNFIVNDLSIIFGYNRNDDRLNDFLKQDIEAFYTTEVRHCPRNIYKDGNIEIEVATVHSVKGETHAATLYLETQYYKYESEHFGPQLYGNIYKQRAGDSRVQASLKVAYVGMSRPKYLLCYAIEKKRFDSIDCERLRELWDVVYA